MVETSTELFENVFLEGKFAKCIFLPDGKLFRCNKAFKELFSYNFLNDEEINLYDFLSTFKSEYKNFKEIIGFENEGNGKKEGKFSLELPEKGKRKVDFSTNSFDYEGKTIVLITFDDVTEEIADRKNLYYMSQRLQLATETFGMGVFDYDFAYARNYISDLVYEIFEINKNDFKDDFNIFLELFHPEDLVILADKWKTGEINGGKYVLNARLILPKSKIKNVLISAVFIIGVNKKPIRFIGTIIDVTSEKENEEILINEKNNYKTLSIQYEESKSNLQSLINNFANTSIWSIDQQYNLIACNDFFREEHHKYFSRWIAKGDNIFDPKYALKEMVDYWKPLYDKSFKGETFTNEYVIADNIFVVSFNPIKVKEEILGVAIYGQNVTEERKVNDLLKFNEERWKFAIEGNNYGLWDYDVLNDNLYFSPNCNKILGYSLEETLFPKIRDWIEIIHSEDVKMSESIYQQIFNGERLSFASELRFKCKNGSYKWLLDRGKVFEFDINGKPTRIIGLLIDITERKDAEKKINEYLKSLEKFAQITSHSLRLPVANIIGITNLIEDEKNSKDLLMLNNSLKISALQLDEVIKEMNEAITYVYKGGSTLSQTKVSNIWFIDDDLINNMLSERMMKKHFPQITSKSFLKAQEALKLLEHNETEPPDAIFLDINMPEMNGWEFLQHFDKLDLSISIYMLTSSIDPKDQEKAHTFSSVKDFISKPLKEDRLKILIK